MVNISKYRAPTAAALSRINKRVRQPRPAPGSVELSWSVGAPLKVFR